jgi:hypothetical protein
MKNVTPENFVMQEGFLKKSSVADLGIRIHE